MQKITTKGWYVTAIMNRKKLYLHHVYGEISNSILNLGWYWYYDSAEGTIYDTPTKAHDLANILKAGGKFPELTNFNVEEVIG